MAYKKHTLENVTNCAILCKTKIEFKKRFPAEYFFAKRNGILTKICSHTISGKKKWFKENLITEAEKYKNRWAFQKGSKGAYLTAFNMGILDEICSHMDKLCRDPYNKENLKEVIAKYESIGDFKKYDQSAYKICRELGLLKKVAGHLKRKCKSPFTKEELLLEAKKYTTRLDFRNNSNSMYNACRRMGILKEACLHMKRTKAVGLNEALIFDELSKYFADIFKYRDYSVSIEGKPHFKHLEIDMFIPSLKKGIEFDGRWYHSYEFMRQDRYKKHWPDEDIRNYHPIKDAYFTSKGISLLHIKEQDWLDNKDECISRIEYFLGITGFMSKLEQKVA